MGEIAEMERLLTRAHPFLKFAEVQTQTVFRLGRKDKESRGLHALLQVVDAVGMRYPISSRRGVQGLEDNVSVCSTKTKILHGRSADSI